MNETLGTNKFAVWVATGLGVGLVSPAPGTVGGLWGLPLAWAIGGLAGVGPQLFAIVAVGLLGVVLCGAAARALGGGKDPQSIVLDEIAALPIVFLGHELNSWKLLLAGWLLFRVFDITKPPPARQFERLPGGWGIMADDTIAAVFGCVALHLLVALDGTMGWNLLPG